MFSSKAAVLHAPTGPSHSPTVWTKNNSYTMTLALQMSLNSHNSELSTAFTHTLPCLLCCIWVFYRFFTSRRRRWKTQIWSSSHLSFKIVRVCNITRTLKLSTAAKVFPIIWVRDNTHICITAERSRETQGFIQAFKWWHLELKSCISL